MTVHGHNGENYPEYAYPAPTYVSDELAKLEAFVKVVCSRLNVDYGDLFISQRIYEAICRVDQRKLHYKIYRKGMELGELNESALLCYWLLRYRPIRYEGDGRDVINEAVVFYIFCSAVNKQRKIEGKSSLDFSGIVHNMLYTFTNRVITYDSMTLLAQAMTIH